MKKTIIFYVLMFSLISLTSIVSKEKCEINPKILNLLSKNENYHCLIINAKPAIKIIMRKYKGNKVDLKKWKITKSFDPYSIYQEIAFKPADGWQLSNLRVTNSKDEESFSRDRFMLTIKGIQDNATLYRRDFSSLYILTNQDCEFPIRLLNEEKKIEEIYILTILFEKKKEENQILLRKGNNMDFYENYIPPIDDRELLK